MCVNGKIKSSRPRFRFQLYHLRATGFSARSGTFSFMKCKTQCLFYTVFEKLNEITEPEKLFWPVQTTYPSGAAGRPLGAGNGGGQTRGVPVLVTAVVVLASISHALICWQTRWLCTSGGFAPSPRKCTSTCTYLWWWGGDRRPQEMGNAYIAWQ